MIVFLAQLRGLGLMGVWQSRHHHRPSLPSDIKVRSPLKRGRRLSLIG